jgi:hypothetical protein
MRWLYVVLEFVQFLVFSILLLAQMIMNAVG